MMRKHMKKISRPIKIVANVALIVILLILIYWQNPIYFAPDSAFRTMCQGMYLGEVKPIFEFDETRSTKMDYKCGVVAGRKDNYLVFAQINGYGLTYYGNMIDIKKIDDSEPCELVAEHILYQETISNLDYGDDATKLRDEIVMFFAINNPKIAEVSVKTHDKTYSTKNIRDGIACLNVISNIYIQEVFPEEAMELHLGSTIGQNKRYNSIDYLDRDGKVLYSKISESEIISVVEKSEDNSYQTIDEIEGM